MQLSRRVRRAIKLGGLRWKSKMLGAYYFGGPSSQHVRVQGLIGQIKRKDITLSDNLKKLVEAGKIPDSAFGTLWHEVLGHHFQMILYGGGGRDPKKLGEAMRFAINRIVDDVAEARVTDEMTKKEAKKVRVQTHKDIEAEIKRLMESYPIKQSTPIASEAFAEFMRYYIIDPEDARKRAPILSETFLDTIKEFPELQSIVDWARFHTQRWLEADLATRGETNIVYDDRVPWEEAWDRGKKGFKFQMTNMFDSVWKMSEHLQINPRLDPMKDRQILVDLTNASDGLAMRALLSDTFDFLGARHKGGPSFDHVMQPVKDIPLRPLDSFLLAQETIYLHNFLNITKPLREGKPRKSPIDAEEITGMPLTEARAVLESHKGDERYDEFWKRWQKYTRWLLKYRRDSGFIDQDKYNRIRDDNEVYVPLMRLREYISHYENQRRSLGKRMANRPKGIYARRGSHRSVLSPITQIVKQTRDVIASAHLNFVARRMYELARDHPEGGRYGTIVRAPMQAIQASWDEVAAQLKVALTADGSLRPITGADVKAILKKSGLDAQDVLTFWRPLVGPPKNRTIQVWINGKRKYFEFTPWQDDTFRVMARLTNIDLSFAQWVLTKPARIFREGVVISPLFWTRQVRDLFVARMRSQASKQDPALKILMKANIPITVRKDRSISIPEEHKVAAAMALGKPAMKELRDHGIPYKLLEDGTIEVSDSQFANAQKILMKYSWEQARWTTPSVTKFFRDAAKTWTIALFDMDVTRGLLGQMDKIAAKRMGRAEGAVTKKTESLVARWNKMSAKEMENLILRGPKGYGAMAIFLDLRADQVEPFILRHMTNRYRKVYNPAKYLVGFMDFWRQLGGTFEMTPRNIEAKGMELHKARSEAEVMKGVGESSWNRFPNPSIVRGRLLSWRVTWSPSQSSLPR
jgi:hypothetical protein